MPDNVLGLDLNRYRPNVPLKQAKSQGVRFLLGKCAEGTTYGDYTYPLYQIEAKKFGFPYGGYLYWRVQFDAVGQAKNYCDRLGDTEFPPILDVERIMNVKYGTNTPLYSYQTNINHIKIVLDEIERRTERKPMIYTNYNSWKTMTGGDSLILGYDAWVANYGRLSPLMPPPKKAWKLWQFTSSYKIIGYNRGVDANWFNGNDAEFEAWLKSTQKAETPPPPEEKLGFFVEIDGRRFEGLGEWK